MKNKKEDESEEVDSFAEAAKIKLKKILASQLKKYSEKFLQKEALSKKHIKELPLFKASEDLVGLTKTLLL